MSDKVSYVAVTNQGAAAPENVESARGIDRDADGKPLVFRTVEDIRTKAPKLWNQIMISFSFGICREARKHSARIKQLSRESRH